jgi:hypothetical protein
MSMLKKEKGQRDNPMTIETLASLSLGRVGWSRDCHLEAARWGFDSPHVHPKLKILPANGWNRLWGMPSGMVPQQDPKAAVILAQHPDESKGQHDVAQLPYRMQKVWKIAQRPTALSLLSMPEDR